jgi:uncharacterized protein
VTSRMPATVVTIAELEATMRDGTILRACAYRPIGNGPWPVLLARTPYGNRDPEVITRLDPARAAGRGFLVIVQDCRGRFRSQGLWTPIANEPADGYDTICWAAQLPGSDGRVCMYGPSYLGHTQWAAISALPPHLCAAVPEFTWSNPDDGLTRRGGAYELGLVTQWTLTLGSNLLARRHAENPAELHKQLTALNTALDGLTTRTYWELPPDQPLHRLGLPVPTAHAVRSPNRTTVLPTLTVAGWYDSFLQGSLDNYLNARSAGSPATLIVGPWSHDNQTGRLGDIDFGGRAGAADLDGAGSLLDRELDWIERQLAPNRAAAEPSGAEEPVLLFVMGVNRWQRFPTWPPETVEVPWYLHDDGGLSRALPALDSPPDEFAHDPHNPVPTHGGALLMPPEFPAGPLDQQEIERRDDVLVYTSTPLDAALEVIGRVRLRLIAESTAPSTDWVARLCDVDEDGVSRNIADGVVRTPHVPEHGQHERRADEIHVDLWSTAHVFLPGHRLRLQIASSCFPRWDRNFGTPAASSGTSLDASGQQPAAGAARQRVHHDLLRPSRLFLPVLQSRAQPDAAPAGPGDLHRAG